MQVQPLLNHIAPYVTLTESEKEQIGKYFSHHTYKKKDILMRGGTTCKHNFFIVKGCAHMYYINDRGIERTVQFALENWWITDNLAYLRQFKTDFFIQTAEDTELLAISFDQQETMLAAIPSLEKYFRLMYQIGYGAAMNKLRWLSDLSKEEIYLRFLEQYPEFAQRVPQYLIASFLGLTPEYVSEIRAKLRS